MKVLIVDDEVIVAKALKRAFLASGHEVFLAHTGEEGLMLWNMKKPDVVFLDVVMPGMSGPQVIQEYNKQTGTENIANYHKHVVILMTAHSSVKHKESALEIGADDFIQKPFENVFDVVKRAQQLMKK